MKWALQRPGQIARTRKKSKRATKILPNKVGRKKGKSTLGENFHGTIPNGWENAEPAKNSFAFFCPNTKNNKKDFCTKWRLNFLSHFQWPSMTLDHSQVQTHPYPNKYVRGKDDSGFPSLQIVHSAPPSLLFFFLFCFLFYLYSYLALSFLHSGYYLRTRGAGFGVVEVGGRAKANALAWDN